MDPNEARPARGDYVRTGITILSPAFYRLNVGSFDFGSVVEERESLVEILALLEENRVRLTSVTGDSARRKPGRCLVVTAGRPPGPAVTNCTCGSALTQACF